MAASQETARAFQAGAGVSPSAAHDAVVAVLACLMLLWAAWIVLRVGHEVMYHRMTPVRALGSVVRAVILISMVIYLMS